MHFRVFPMLNTQLRRSSNSCDRTCHQKSYPDLNVHSLWTSSNSMIKPLTNQNWSGNIHSNRNLELSRTTNCYQPHVLSLFWATGDLFRIVNITGLSEAVLRFRKKHNFSRCQSMIRHGSSRSSFHLHYTKILPLQEVRRVSCG